MRPLKFRAWHKIRKEMYQVHGWHSEFVFKDTFDGVGNDGNPDKLEDVELMQFTGLKDSKRTEKYPEGQDIYEGDIVKTTHIISIGLIEYKNKGFLIKDLNQDIYVGDRYNWNDIEIIGNIHENPELL